MIINTFSDYESARAKLGELNVLAGLPGGYDLTSIYTNEAGDQWVFNGSDCIEQGGLGRSQIATIINGLSSFTVATYEDFFNLGYKSV